MDAYVQNFMKLAGSAKARPKGAEDYFDRLNYVMTPSILLVIATIIGMKQYVFEPIQCWNLKELDGGRMEYAENYCWVENTFYYEPEEPIAHVNDPGDGRRIYYYQWVPFLLMAQAILFYVPHLVWILLSSNVGIDVRQLATQSRSIEAECGDTEARQKKIAYLADSLLRFMRFRSRYRQSSYCRRLLSFVFGKPAFAMYFVFAYLLVKACYVANCVGQLYLMRSSLGLNMTSFGLQILKDISSNRTWQSSNIFPRVTYCHFEVRAVGKPHPYILQCVLPVNMLNEKFYIAIWFWVVFLLTMNIVSTIRCILKLLLSSTRHRRIKKYLKIAETIDSNTDQTKRFTRSPGHEDQFFEALLRTDGNFMLTVINRNAGDIITAEVVKETFLKWRGDRFLSGRHDGHSDDASDDQQRMNTPENPKDGFLMRKLNNEDKQLYHTADV